MIKILSLVSMTNLGDVNHVNSVASILTTMITENVEIINLDANSDPAVIKKAYTEQSSEKHIVLVAGEKGLGTLSGVLNQEINSDKAYVYFGSHQYNPSLQNSVNIDHIALPKTELTNPEKEKVVKSFPHYTLTFAVPNINLSSSELEKEYDCWELKEQYPVEKYIVVMLPGDAPDENGTMKYFSKNSATKIAKEIANLWEQNTDYKILIENGPRTGKFHPKTGEIICKHEYNKGEDADGAIDEISKHFITKLKSYTDAEKVHFFNFSFERDGSTTNKISFNNQLLYLAQALEENYFVVPGESTSLIAETTLRIKGDHLIGVKPDSMNNSHTALFEEAVQQGLISYFDNDDNLIFPINPNMRTEDDSMVVAGDIYQGFSEKFDS